MKQLAAAAALPLALAACSEAAVRNDQVDAKTVNAAAPAAANVLDEFLAAANYVVAEEVLRSETLTGAFTGWDRGGDIQAQLAVPDRGRVLAQPGWGPIALFLDTHRNQQLTVEIATLRTDNPSGEGRIEIQRIVAARTATVDADAWWRSITPPEREAATRRLENRLMRLRH